MHIRCPIIAVKGGGEMLLPYPTVLDPMGAASHSVGSPAADGTSSSDEGSSSVRTNPVPFLLNEPSL